MPPTDPDRCGNCGSTRIVLVNGSDEEAMCSNCSAPICGHCSQVMLAVQEEDGSIGRRHERDDLVAPRCPVHKAELVTERRAQMHLVKGGEAS